MRKTAIEFYRTFNFFCLEYELDDHDEVHFCIETFIFIIISYFYRQFQYFETHEMLTPVQGSPCPKPGNNSSSPIGPIFLELPRVNEIYHS